MKINGRKRPQSKRRSQYAHASTRVRPSVANSSRTTRRKHTADQASTRNTGVENDSTNIANILLTRRGFLYGIAGVAAAAAVGTAAFAATGGFSPKHDTPALSVPTSSVFTTDNCEYIENNQALRVVTSVSLPYGTMVWASDPSVAACLLPTETGKPLTNVGLISLSAGTCRTILDKAHGQSDGFEIYDARATSSGLIWTEADILDGNWRVYQATLSGAQLGEPVLMHEGDTNWEMPTLAASGNYAFWQVLPQLNGNATKEDSLMMCVEFGGSPEAARTLYTSHGRMACSPSPSASGIACAPRADTSDTRYQLTHIDAATGEVTDALALPASMRPIYVAYGESGFAFSFDGIYNYGDGIANLGTYTPASAPTYDLKTATADAQNSLRDKNGQLSERNAEEANARAAQAVADLYSSSTWFRFPRTPVTPPAWYNNWFVVKSTRAVSGVDLGAKRYFALDVENGAPDYGEFLASYGTCQNLVTYTNIDYTPINGDPIKECRMKVWKTV